MSLPDKESLPSIFMFWPVVVILLLTGAVYYTQPLQKNTLPQQLVVAPVVPTATTTPSPVVNAITYVRKDKLYAFQYPEDMPLVREDARTAEFSTHTDTAVPFPDLTVSSTSITRYDTMLHCVDSASHQQTFPCIAPGRDSGQSEDTMAVSLDGNAAISFYLGGSINSRYHIVQTTQAPKVELKMYIAADTSDQVFQKIMTSFTFQADTTWNTYLHPQRRYKISYPVRAGRKQDPWTFTQTVDGVEFGPALGKSDAPRWSVHLYPPEQANELLKDTGKQFADRKESVQDVIVNGIPALLVTVTRSHTPGWTSQAVYILDKNQLYVISDNATTFPDFAQFYQSFTLL